MILEEINRLTGRNMDFDSLLEAYDDTQLARLYQEATGVSLTIPDMLKDAVDNTTVLDSLAYDDGWTPDEYGGYTTNDLPGRTCHMTESEAISQYEEELTRLLADDLDYSRSLFWESKLLEDWRI